MKWAFRPSVSAEFRALHEEIKFQLQKQEKVPDTNAPRITFKGRQWRGRLYCGNRQQLLADSGLMTKSSMRPQKKLRKLVSKGSLPWGNPWGLVCRQREQPWSGSLAPRQTELAAARITLWWPPGPEGGGPLAAQPGDRASSPYQSSGCSRGAEGRAGAGPWSSTQGWWGQDTPECRQSPGQGHSPVRASRLQGGHGAELGTGCGSGCGTVPPGQSSFSLSVESSWGHLCCSRSCVCHRLRLCFPLRRACCIGLFSSHCWSAQASCSSFQFIKKASAPPLAS